jgi:hypothetical protein
MVQGVLPVKATISVENWEGKSNESADWFSEMIEAHRKRLNQSKPVSHTPNTPYERSSVVFEIIVWHRGSLFFVRVRRYKNARKQMAQPSKQDSQQLLAKLKSKGTANKVGCSCNCAHPRLVLTVVQRIQHGAPCRLGYTSVLTAAPCIGTLVCTSHLSGISSGGSF